MLVDKRTQVWKSVSRNLRRISTLPETFQRKGSIAFKRGSSLLLKRHRDQANALTQAVDHYNIEGIKQAKSESKDLDSGSDESTEIPQGRKHYLNCQ